ncbi:TonB-dependent receptor [soil metagenome]
MTACPLRISPLCLALAGLFTAAGAAAQSADPKAETVLGVVVVHPSADASAGGLQAPYAGGQVARGGRVGILGSQDNLSTPFSVTAYTQKLIQDQQAQSVADILLNDPTVRTARGFGNFQQVYYIRGLPVFSDDIAYNGLYGLLPRQYLAAEVIERLEVLRGATAFLNGAAPGGSGLGGSINVMPKRASDTLNEVTFGIESGGQNYAAADFARRFADDAFGIRLNVARRDGYTAVEREERKLEVAAVGFDFHTANLRLSAGLGFQNHRLTATQPSVTFSGTPILKTPDASKNVGQPWTFSNERDVFGTFRAEYDLSASITAWGALGMRHGNEAGSFANPTVFNTAGDMSATNFVNAREDRILTGEVGARARFDTAGIGHSVVASLAAYQSKSKNAFEFSSFAGFTSNLYDPIDVARPPTSSANFPGGDLGDPLLTVRTKTSSAAISDTLAFLDDKLLVTGGLRSQKIEGYSYDYNSGGQLSDYSKNKITPVGGIVYKFDKRLSLYANYIEGLIQGDTAPAIANERPVTNGGKVFSPAVSKQAEIGAKFDLGRIGGTVSLFNTKKPVYGVDASNTYSRIDNQKNKGVELSVFGEAARGVRLLGGATYLDTDIGGNDAIGAPKTQVNAGAEWDVPMLAGVTLDTRAIYTAHQYADLANDQRVPSWTRFDIGARYVVDLGAQTLTLRARIENVADRDYWASAGGFPGAGYLTFGAPRTWMLSGTLSF